MYCHEARVFPCTTVTTLPGATAAATAEQTCLILTDAYFPQITYPDTGDSICFVNVSGVEHNIVSRNSEWEIGPIPDQGEVVIEVDSITERSFFNKDAVADDGSFIVQGGNSFDQAPLN